MCRDDLNDASYRRKISVAAAPSPAKSIVAENRSRNTLPQSYAPWRAGGSALCRDAARARGRRRRGDRESRMSVPMMNAAIIGYVKMAKRAILNSRAADGRRTKWQHQNISCRPCHLTSLRLTRRGAGLRGSATPTPRWRRLTSGVIRRNSKLAPRGRRKGTIGPIIGPSIANKT